MWLQAIVQAVLVSASLTTKERAVYSKLGSRLAASNVVFLATKKSVEKTLF